MPNIYLKRFCWLLAATLSLGQFACAQAQDEPISTPFPGQLLFVEDLDGQDGLQAGSFGDMVEISSDQRRRLTHDSFYDTSPSWSPDMQRVLFESKRNLEGSRIFDLSKPSNLYMLDTQTGKVEQFGQFLQDQLPQQVGTDNEAPAWSANGRMIAFLTSIDFERRAVIVDLEDMTTKTLRLEKIDPHWIGRFTWALNGEALLFDYGSPSAAIRALALYDFTTDSTRIITDNMEKGLRWGKGATTCEGGSWLSSGTGFIYACSPLGGEQTTIYQYDLDTDSSKVVAEIKDHYATSPQLSEQQQKLIYIARDNKAKWHDLWLYDLTTKESTRLTNDGRAKTHLLWRE